MKGNTLHLMMPLSSRTFWHDFRICLEETRASVLPEIDKSISLLFLFSQAGRQNQKQNSMLGSFAQMGGEEGVGGLWCQSVHH